MTNARQARADIRDTLERYMACIDVKDWAGVAACFAEDSESLYNGDPTALVGGEAVAGFIERATAAYSSTVHSLAGCHVDLDGSRAHVRSRALIGIHLPTTDSVSIRAIAYDDELRAVDDSWLITRRRHEALWQADMPAATPHLVMSAGSRRDGDAGI